VNVVVEPVERLNVYKLPKQTYWAGEFFDTTGMAVEAITESGRSFELTVAQLTISPSRALVTGDTQITLTYFDHASSKIVSATIPITVREKQPGVDPEVKVSIGNARPGQEVTVNISIENNPGFAGMPIKVSFPEELTLTSFQLGNLDLLAGFTGPDGVSPGIVNMAPGVQTSISNFAYFIWGRTADYNQNGVILALTFIVDPNANKGFYDIEVDFSTRFGFDTPSNLNGKNLDIIRTHGGVKVNTFVLGSTTGSGNVGTADLVLLARYLAGHNVTIDTDAAKVTSISTAQGVIRTADLVMLARYLAGHNVVLGE
jgi:hypothetical protein